MKKTVSLIATIVILFCTIHAVFTEEPVKTNAQGKVATEAEATARAKEEEATRAKAEAEEAARSAAEAKAAAEAALKEARAVAEAAEKKAAEAEALARAEEASRAREQAEAATQTAEEAKAQAEAAEQRASEAIEAKEAAEQRASEAIEAKEAAERQAAEATEAKEVAEQRAAEATEAKAAAEQRAAVATEAKDDLAAREEQRQREEYDSAVALYERGNYEAAKTAFEKLDSYLDSLEYVDKCDEEITKLTHIREMRAQIPVITSIELDDNNPVITWMNVEEADYYTIYRSEDEKAYENLNVNTEKNSYTTKSCKEGREYFFKIKAILKDGSSTEFSEAVSISIPEKAPVGSQPPEKEDNQENLYTEAIAFLNDGNYQAAEEAFESLGDYKDCQEKLSEVRYYLGLNYETGDGVQKKEKWALSYYQLAADAGYADAVNKLGECAYNGIGGSQDYNEAFEYFSEAANLGSAKAYYNLGLCYENGYGTEKNGEYAMMCYKIAADMGNQDALKKVKK